MVPIFIEEKDWVKLFDYLHKNSSLELLLQTSQYLQPHCHEQLLKLFRDKPYTFTETNVNKTSYKLIAKVLQHMFTLEEGKPRVTELLADFRELFPKRRAMMVQLDKVKIN